MYYHSKYITTPESNRIFCCKISTSKIDIANFVKKITSNKTKHVVVENEFKKLQTFDSSLFIGQNYFNNDGE